MKLSSLLVSMLSLAVLEAEVEARLLGKKKKKQQQQQNQKMYSAWKNDGESTELYGEVRVIEAKELQPVTPLKAICAGMCKNKRDLNEDNSSLMNCKEAFAGNDQAIEVCENLAVQVKDHSGSVEQCTQDVCSEGKQDMNDKDDDSDNDGRPCNLMCDAVFMPNCLGLSLNGTLSYDQCPTPDDLTQKFCGAEDEECARLPDAIFRPSRDKGPLSLGQCMEQFCNQDGRTDPNTPCKAMCNAVFGSNCIDLGADGLNYEKCPKPTELRKKFCAEEDKKCDFLSEALFKPRTDDRPLSLRQCKRKLCKMEERKSGKKDIKAEKKAARKVTKNAVKACKRMCKDALLDCTKGQIMAPEPEYCASPMKLRETYCEDSDVRCEASSVAIFNLLSDSPPSVRQCKREFCSFGNPEDDVDDDDDDDQDDDDPTDDDNCGGGDSDDSRPYKKNDTCKRMCQRAKSNKPFDLKKEFCSGPLLLHDKKVACEMMASAIVSSDAQDMTVGQCIQSRCTGMRESRCTRYCDEIFHCGPNTKPGLLGQVQYTCPSMDECVDKLCPPGQELGRVACMERCTMYTSLCRAKCVLPTMTAEPTGDFLLMKQVTNWEYGDCVEFACMDDYEIMAGIRLASMDKGTFN